MQAFTERSMTPGTTHPAAGAVGLLEAQKLIRDDWLKLKSSTKLHTRDIAAEFGISEAELLASAVGEHVTRLNGNVEDLLVRIPDLGSVMALTRNESCVHEKDGPYQNISLDGHVGLVLGDPIDLRLFLNNWTLAYAVTDESARGTQRSIQFFDACGTAVHKVYLRPQSNVAALDAIVADFASVNQLPGEKVLPFPTPITARPRSDIDVGGLQSAWSALQDTHEFVGLLKQFGVTRVQAMRLAGHIFATPARTDSARLILEAAAASKLEIMIFVGNRGCIQIHSGHVHTIKEMGHWLNVLDPGFNLHLRLDHIAESWVVSKPTRDGIVTSLELFDAKGEVIAMMFGKRKPGQHEQPVWRDLVTDLLVPK